VVAHSAGGHRGPPLHFFLTEIPDIERKYREKKIISEFQNTFHNPFLIKPSHPLLTLPLEGGGLGGGDSLGYVLIVNRFFWLRLRRTVNSVTLG
jgi:hypothetical protein